MAKQELPQRGASAKARASAAERRDASERHGAVQPAARAPSSVMRLAAEVERLQAELAAMRAKLADVEAKVDIDPLLDIFNRRGFARERSRALSFVARYGTRAA